MTEIRKSLDWPCTLDEAVRRVVLEPIEKPSIVEAMKDVKSCTVLKNEWSKEVFYYQLDLRMDPPIPMALRSLLKPGKLGWIQDGRWTPKTGLYEVTVTPFMFSNIIKVSKKSHFKVAGKNQAVQDILFKANCDLPLLGGAMEQFVLGKLIESVEDQFKKTVAELTGE